MRTALIECGSPGAASISVLKFGSSVLGGANGFHAAVEEIQRDLARGRKVLAVVSALPGTTDRLLDIAVCLHRGATDGLVAQLLATGENASVVLLGMALTGAGVHAQLLAPEGVGLITTGPLGDAEPVHLEEDALLTSLRAHSVVVAPGFVALDASGAPSLLGRGGSDLTALFLADRLGAEEVRLIKDVDGVHSYDPKRTDGAEPLARATWEEVARVGAGVVQEKALRFAAERRISFRVCAPGGRGTLVGAEGRP
jgi:homoserine dehydrogenase